MNAFSAFWHFIHATFPWRLVRIVACAFVGVLLVLMYFENRLVYHPATAQQDWQPAPSALIQDVELTMGDGTRLHAWWAPFPGSDDALLYLHGNAGNLSHRGPSMLKVRELLKAGVLIPDYPGFGKSEGSPSEAGCYATADAAYDWLLEKQKIDPKRIVLYGVSLGGGVAVNLASRRDHRALVLIKTFTSMPDVGQHLHPWLPVHWLMSNRYDNLSKIGQCQRPVFITNSRDDGLVPFAQGQRLFDAANPPKKFFPLAGGHNDGLTPQFFQAVQSFLQEEAPVAAEPVGAAGPSRDR